MTSMSLRINKLKSLLVIFRVVKFPLLLLLLLLLVVVLVTRGLLLLVLLGDIISWGILSIM